MDLLSLLMSMNDSVCLKQVREGLQVEKEIDNLLTTKHLGTSWPNNVRKVENK